MHPFIDQLSIFTWMDIIGSKERCVAFLQSLELIPKMHDSCAPECPKCSGPMTVSFRNSYILGWRWVCKKFHKKENPCLGYANPLDGTFFEGLKLPLVDVLALMFGYILKISYDGMKDHLDCWRSRRKGRVISGNTIINFYSRFDKIILYALNQEGETFKKHGKIDRKKLWKKYTKTLNTEPFFRNIVFRLLMDIKSRYPCSKSKLMQANVDLCSSVDATNASLSAKNISSNGTILNASNSTISNISNSVNSNVLNSSSSIVSNVSNSTILSASDSSALNASNLSVLNVCNSAVSSSSTSIVSNLLTSTISPALHSSAVSVENTRIGSDINSKSLCVLNNVQSSNIGVSKNSNLSSCSNTTSVAEETAVIENTSSTVMENVMTLNNIAPSTDISFDITKKSFIDNFISNSPPSNVIIDSIFYDNIIMDVAMDIDHDEVIATTYNND